MSTVAFLFDNTPRCRIMPATHAHLMKTSLSHVTTLFLAVAAPLVVTSCGDDSSKPAKKQQQVDPTVRKNALAKLKELGLEFSPRAFLTLLTGSCKSEVLQLYLEAGMSANGTDGGGRNTLMIMILNGTDKEEVVKCAEVLIKHGVNLRATDNSWQNALHYAVSRNNPALVKLLIDAGVDVNAVDRSGLSVLTRTFNSECIELLKAAGAQEGKK